MLRKYLPSITILLLFLTISINAKQKLLNTFKISSHLPTHIFSPNNPPTFKIIINTNKKLKGKLRIKLKKITEDNFKQIFETKIKLDKGNNQYELTSTALNLTNMQSEFYEIYSNFITDEAIDNSDTLTFVFNYDSLTYKPNKPEDLENFWLNTFLKLDSIPPNFRIDTVIAKETEKSKVYKVSFDGLDSMVIKSWYCIPKNSEKSPTILLLPSYGNAPIPVPYNFCENGFAVLAIQIHGKDVEGDNYPIGDDPSAGLNLDNANKYYLRNAVAHIKRALDFLHSQTEIDTNQIAAVGTSQGGGLALLITGLDRRIKTTAATIPTLISYPEALSSGGYWRIKKAIKNGIVDLNTALKTLSYFDALNLSDNISNPILLSVHFKDRISTPNTVLSFYNSIKTTDKHLIIQPELGHQFPEHHWDITIDWLKMIFKM